MSESEVREVVDFLMFNYYPKYKGRRVDVVPTHEQVMQGIRNHPDKVMVVRDDKVKGVGIFVTLSDDTYKRLRSLDVTRMEIIQQLIGQHGPNIHFVLLCADGYRTIAAGIRQVKKKYQPKTISWWNPDLSFLHVYKGA